MQGTRSHYTKFDVFSLVTGTIYTANFWSPNLSYTYIAFSTNIFRCFFVVMNLAYILEDSTSAFSDHLLYFLYLSSFVIFLFFLLKYSIQKKSEYNFLVNAHVSIDEVYQILYHNTPPSSTNGWKCVGIFDGCRLWSINKRTISGIPGELISCMSFLTHTPVKDLMDVFLDPREFFEWNFIFGSISQVKVNSSLHLTFKFELRISFSSIHQNAPLYILLFRQSLFSIPIPGSIYSFVELYIFCMLYLCSISTTFYKLARFAR